ncbi:MAG TPA: hypothetical protein VFU43_03300 [Streptosporangiaceae bacterium]|nr:hypothetical protein [Streptosporangiaceae bacterium]
MDEDDEGKYAVTSIRRFGALAVALAVGVVAFGPGAAAQAARSGISSPGSNAIITRGSTTTVSAHLDLLATGDLYIRGPGTGGDRKIGGGIGPRDISESVNIGRNGAYVVTLKGLLGTIDQRTFYVRVPPARPSGVDASVSERKLVVRWDRGNESDLTGYDVYVGGARKRQGSPGALCAAEVCSTALSLPATGGRVDVGVRARRSNGTGGTVVSDLSTTSVTLPVAAAFAGAGRTPTTQFPSPAPSANPLLPLPGSSPLSLPTVAPDGLAAGFQYPTPGPQVASPVTAPSAEKASADGPMRWGKSVALALIMLIVAAHLGAWTRRLRLAQPAEAGAAAIRSRARRQKKSPGETERTHGTPAGPEPDEAGKVAVERPVRAGDRGTPSPGSGRLIDAKGPVVDATLLRSGQRESAAPSGEQASSRAVAATAGAASRAATPRAQHSKAGGSRARRSQGYRGRRRAD